MIDGENSRRIAFEYVSTIDNVKILKSTEKENVGFKTELEIWEVDTEILFDNKIVPIAFHIIFTSQFPLEFPKIFLSQDSYERTKYIPHVDNNRLVCTYDSEISSTNPNDPAGIVVECLRKTKSIVLDGMSGQNHSDFNDEFKAYWEEKYNKEKDLPQNVLSLINEIKDEEKLRLLCLKKSIRNYHYVIHSSNETAERFKEFLGEYNFEYSEIGMFYLGGFSQNKPPFDLKNKDVLNFVKSLGEGTFLKYKAFINNKEYPKLIVCEKFFGKKSFIFGWFHKTINTNINGFRPGALKPFRALSTIQSNDSVNRITTDVYTMERLDNRTSGVNRIDSKKEFSIGGVGSIGSNLVYFLNSINTPDFKFIDTDKLRLENIQRHLLGFEYIGSYKTKALKDYIQSNNPLQRVSTKEGLIIDVIKNELEFLNESDYIFMCIGKANIDNWVCRSLKEGFIKKPLFIIWVEPFLCGGHCIYLHPSNPEFEKYFEEELFKFNVIDSSEYKLGNKKLSLREAGCQTTYIPYSGTNVISFLSSLFPFISSIIDKNKTESVAYSWIGNIDELEKIELKLSDYYINIDTGTIIEHNL